MEMKFESNLEYQDEAIAAAVDLFNGQGLSNSVFTVSGAYNYTLQNFSHSGVGVGNRIDISEDEVLENLRQVQLRNNLPPSDSLNGNLDFVVEMETGTGKTYVYSKTILRLNQKYGFTKFIIVVPSIAIKEGVNKSFQLTRSHFGEEFGNIPYIQFVYDSKKVDYQIRDFATNDVLSIMIINIDAFRRSFDDPNDDSKKANIIHRPNDKLNGLKPIDLIKETNPIVIIDEPQSVVTTDTSKTAIASLNPLCIFRYSATPDDARNMIYRLDAVDAYEKKLVKGIDVAGFSSMNQHNNPYVRLVSVDNKKSPITAKIEVDVKDKDGIKRKTIKVDKGSDLSSKTKRDVYDGYIVDEIYCEAGNEYIHFSPIDVTVRLGESIGDIDDLVLKRHMISKTIQEHLDKEVELNKEGIKVLSLFFIDRVAKYRDGDKEGVYAEMFEEEYAKLIVRPKYKDILGHCDPKIQAHEAHGGYFSQDKAGYKDTSGKSDDDDSTYNLIMKDKEKLLQFSTKLRFIFSHSALREGWDNPNVFQICTLNETRSTVKKRQEIGRGLRLCVNQDGVRVRDPYKNQLTIMANESYEEFAANLQSEYEKDSGIKFGIIEKHSFANIVVDSTGHDPEYLGQFASERIFTHFKEIGYIDSKGKVQESLKKALIDNNLDLPEDVIGSMSAIQDRCKRITGKLNIKNNDDKRKVTLRKEMYLSDDFKELWNRIKYRTKYNLHFDSQELIDSCIKELNKSLEIKRPATVYIKAKLDINAGGVDAYVQAPEVVSQDRVPNELLPDVITYLQNSTDLTRRTIVSILVGCDRLDDFRKNPQMFMEQASKIINSNVRRLALDGISYVRLGDSEYYAQEFFSDEELFGYLNKNMVETSRSLYDHTVFDSDVERDFALGLDKDEHVKLFFKIPDWFRIPTPIGDYNPDWAVLMNWNGDERLYFVFETKGNKDNNRPTESFKIECGRRHFKAIDPSINYSVVTSTDDILIEGSELIGE